MLTEAIKEDKKKTHTRTVTDIEHTNNIFRTRLFFTSLAFEKKKIRIDSDQVSMTESFSLINCSEWYSQISNHWMNTTKCLGLNEPCETEIKM